MAKTITVIGAGISGLSCAVALQAAGFRVRIVAADAPPNTTSAAAAGIWMPFHAGDHPRTGAWLRATYDHCRLAQADPATGIFFIEHNSYFRTPDFEMDDELRAADGFSLLEPADLKYGAHAGFSLRLPVMPSTTLLPFLTRQFEARGGDFAWRSVTNLADESIDADLVVNCTGHGARALCGDETVEVAKGQVVVVDNPGLQANIVVTDPDAFTHIFPCGDQCILGGVYDIGQHDLTPDARTTADIRARAIALEPSLAAMPVRAVRTGLRPLRPAVRLEAETLPGGSTVIHNYGHGGAGYSLAHGCAQDVASLARELLL